MRIGVDASCFEQRRGYGRFTRELLSALFREGKDDTFLVFTDEEAAKRFPSDLRNVEVVGVPLKSGQAESAAADGYRAPSDLLRMSRAVKSKSPDVFFFPTVYTYFPMLGKQRCVVAIHDAIAERFPKLTLPTLRARIFWKLKVRLAIRQASLIVTVSEFAARDLERVLKIPASRIRVAVEAPSRDYSPVVDPSKSTTLAERLGVPKGEPYFTYVGGFNPHKNIDVLLRAHSRISAALPEKRPWLVLAGPGRADNFHQAGDAISASLSSSVARERVLWPGFLEDSDLCLLHAGARALVLPSACEGFGLPAVEAAASGAPVIATTESPLPELLEGGGFFVAPGDEDALTSAMERLLRDDTLRAELGTKAASRAALLSWERAARVVHSALKEAAS